ncbi:ATP-binding protein [Microvirga sp. STR05]|uniref:ATP-binding protein n=1 Tax=Hymenobacter duratus TaxID=2771356 RepID=A0ABR8JER9_9BACT|nr:ATP-binding protein [Hymenobacter duratus]MBD2714537.1 ATP-binding protein [Hymenobacter duratus]MBR7949441.1 ATP-binding protein [Microvirga sp. STR05]
MKNALRISCSRHNLKVVRDFVTDYLKAYQLPDLQLNQIVLAVDEVVANLIIHANSEDESQHLDLALDVSNKQFGIEIFDDATSSYAPSTYHEPDLQEYIRQGRKGGVGMTLVNRIMDRVEFSTQGRRNVCRLYKQL